MRRKNSDSAALEDVCRQRGLTLTIQRRAVLGVLLRRSDHPTADAIYEDVASQLRGISRPTVYRVLQMLVDIGVARKVCHPGAATRYEVQKEPHHHLVCLHCEKMVDFRSPALNSLRLPDFGRTGFRITDYTVQFRGLCRECYGRLAKRRRGKSRGVSRHRRGKSGQKGGSDVRKN